MAEINSSASLRELDASTSRSARPEQTAMGGTTRGALTLSQRVQVEAGDALVSWLQARGWPERLIKLAGRHSRRSRASAAIAAPKMVA